MTKTGNLDVVPLTHNPSMPVRQDIIGEVVFSEAWTRLMAIPPRFFMGDESTQLDACLGAYQRRSGQREATLAASLVTWFGTNCGGSFLREARTLADRKAMTMENSYLAAWVVQNARKVGLNHGIRTLEHCMGTEHFDPGFGFGLVRKPADLTADDYECAEHLVMWFGGHEGQKFLAYCEEEIARRSNPIKFPFEADHD